MRDQVLNINKISRLLRKEDLLEMEILTFLRLAEYPVHKSKLNVNARKNEIDKALKSLKDKRFVGQRLKMLSVNRMGHEFIDNMLSDLRAIEKEIADDI